jgi:hypothetical protein
MKLKFLTMLFGMGLSIIFMMFFVQYKESQQQIMDKWIYDTHQERLLSQQALAHVFQFIVSKDPLVIAQAARDLSGVTDTLKVTYKDLALNSHIAQVGHRLDREIKAFYQTGDPSIHDRMLTFLKSLKALSESASLGKIPEDHPQLQAVMGQGKEVLEALRTVVNFYEAQDDQAASDIKLCVGIVLGIVLLFMGVLYGQVYAPLEAELTKHRQEAIEKERSLNMALHKVYQLPQLRSDMIRDLVLALSPLLDLVKEGLPQEKKEVATLVTLLHQQLNWLMELSHLEVGSINLHVQPVTFGDIFQPILEAFQPFLDKRGVHLDVNYPSQKVLYTDARLFQRFITLLIWLNAQRAPDTTQTLTVVPLDSTVERWSLTLSDNGIGLTRSEVDSFFEPFHKSAWMEGALTLSARYGYGFIKNLGAFLGGTFSLKTQAQATHITFVFPPRLEDKRVAA